MKNKSMRYLSFALLSLLIFTSCQDSPESLIQDQIEHVESFYPVFEDYGAGKISQSEMNESFKTWSKKWETFDERLDKLKESMSLKEIQDMYLAKKDDIRPKLDKFFKLAGELEQKGKLSLNKGEGLDETFLSTDSYAFFQGAANFIEIKDK